MRLSILPPICDFIHMRRINDAFLQPEPRKRQMLNRIRFIPQAEHHAPVPIHAPVRSPHAFVNLSVLSDMDHSASIRASLAGDPAARPRHSDAQLALS